MTYETISKLNEDESKKKTNKKSKEKKGQVNPEELHTNTHAQHKGYEDEHEFKKDKIYNSLTYERIRIFHTMLKFGMYTSFISHVEKE